MSEFTQNSLRQALLAPISGGEQASRWCANTSQLALPLQTFLRKGQRHFSFSLSELGMEQGVLLQKSLLWSQVYKRQTGCPSDFAWVDLHALPWACDGVELVLAFDRVLPQWGGSGQPLAEDRHVLLLLPALLKGLIAGIRAEKCRGLQLNMTGMRVHLVDSRPSSFFRCGLQALEHLMHSNAGLL
ncbi:MAG: hypothetical protein AB7I41_00400 [Candidatus Sericytochromatia bacterium]